MYNSLRCCCCTVMSMSDKSVERSKTCRSEKNVVRCCRTSRERSREDIKCYESFCMRVGGAAVLHCFPLASFSSCFLFNCVLSLRFFPGLPAELITACLLGLGQTEDREKRRSSKNREKTGAAESAATSHS